MLLAPVFRRSCGKAGLCLLVMFSLIAGGARTGWGFDLMPHSVSRSRQFFVYARDSAVRNAVGTVGDETKSELLRALAVSDDWKLPIVVDMRVPDPGTPNDRPPARLILAQTGLGLKVELDLLLGEAGRGIRIRDELVRAMLLEMAYRDHRELMAGVGYALPPPWLVEGFSAYIENAETGVSARMYAALLPASQSLSISEFLTRDPAKMDSTSHAVYRAYAFNLVSLLVNEMEGGRAGMVAFIHDLSSLPAEEARSAGVLGQHFPQLAANPDSLEKWWTLGLARLAASDRFQAYTVQETDDHIEQLLSFPGPADAKKTSVKTYRLSDFEKFTPLKQNKQMLEGTRAGLILLTGRANPLNRPIVMGYQEVVEELRHNHTKGVAEKLENLAQARKAVVKRREGIADYLNWYEATQMTDQSGAFEEYFRTARQVDRPQAVHRPDAISAYLDEMDMEYRSVSR